MEDSEPEELPMDQVLGEIRQMLMSNMEQPEMEPIKKEPVMEQVVVKKTEPAYFLLTPAMRCDLPSDTELSETVQRRAQQVLNKLQKGSESENISPAVSEWLEKHLPELVEQAVAKKMSENKI